MPQIQRGFSEQADASGAFLFTSEPEDLPISVKLEQYSLQTTSGCKGRQHNGQITLQRTDQTSDPILINITFKDCEILTGDLNLAVNHGHYQIKLLVGGFDPNEPVSGNTTLSYEFEL